MTRKLSFAEPPVERLCALEMADRWRTFKIPVEGPIAHADGWAIFFYLQPAGAPPVETVYEVERGVNILGDADARRVWEAAA